VLKKILLISALALACIALTNCADMLNQQSAKDRDLGHMTEQNMKTSPDFSANVESLGWDSVTGKYKLVTKDLNDAQSAGKYAYNAMVTLYERNNTKVKTGRNQFTMVGVQNGVEIFEVFMTAGSEPQVTLKGPYAGEAFTPNIKGAK
jgi:Tol biopolymer transport system component